MASPDGTTRVGMLVPMEIELAPLVRILGLAKDGPLYRGSAGDVEVVALLTTIGMEPGARAARQMLDLAVDAVLVVGVAGGVDPATVSIGDVVVPETVLDRATGATYSPSITGDATPRGTVSCGDDLITDPATLAAMANQGVIAVEMETAAIAPVCVEAGCPWGVFRGISDFAGEGLVDAELFAMTRPDGTADRDAMARYLEKNPGKIEVLTRLGHDTGIATDAAANAAIRACATV
jgi:adenosylhomocysteine nucleosidase